MTFFLEPLVFFLTSVVSVVLIYYKIPIATLQQIILGILIVLLLSFRWLLAERTKRLIKVFARLVLLSLSSLFVQILVISSGGFYSPLLILLHLYTLGASFLLNIPSSISFLVFSVAVLITNIVLDPKLQSIFRDDPGSAILYIVSFLVIIPLAQTLMKTYHLKDALAKILYESLNLRVLREKSILTSLNEIVVITDHNLKIISANDAFEDATGLSGGEFINQNFLDKISLVDRDNVPANSTSLSIKDVLVDQTNHIVSGFYLSTKGNPKSRQVVVEVKPIVGVSRTIIQLVFVIKEPRAAIEIEPHTDLEAAHTKQNMIITNIKRLLVNFKEPGLKTELELLQQGESDLLIAQELEDHPIKNANQYEDIVLLCKKAISYKQDLARSLGVNLQLIFPNAPGESSYLNLRETNSSLISQVVSDYAAQVNVKWFGILLSKLLDIAVLLSSGQKNPTVVVSINIILKSEIEVELVFPSPVMTPEKQKELFLQYYGDLAATTNLRLGSGLEGFIAKVVADQLNINLDVKTKEGPDRLVFRFKLYKKPAGKI
ncbi:PAS domain-containing protein [Candidatus Daviesbacteria bacterium]|nr:PAS domain-containing protein [Candidatus Daviesbacteria bacterium]